MGQILRIKLHINSVYGFTRLFRGVETFFVGQKGREKCLLKSFKYVRKMAVLFYGADFSDL